MSTSEQLNVDLQQMIDDCRPDPTNFSDPDKQVNAETKLRMKLASYITRREHNAFNEGYQKGKSNAQDQI